MRNLKKVAKTVAVGTINGVVATMAIPVGLLLMASEAIEGKGKHKRKNNNFVMYDLTNEEA